MNKEHLLAELMARTGLPRRRVERAAQAVFATLSEGLVAGERVEVRSFGNFVLRTSGAHTGRHPRTGAAREVAAQRCVLFRPGKALRAALNAPAAISPAGGGGDDDDAGSGAS